MAETRFLGSLVGAQKPGFSINLSVEQQSYDRNPVSRYSCGGSETGFLKLSLGWVTKVMAETRFLDTYLQIGTREKS
ncbi:hypothetical protein [Planktothrix sp. FACHB-1365]|uniref:hypothetical protein n=1 Tax=Planktothrix sp. FACHB-1365 TaxID=2692855 RepID=UPI001682AD3F|nr:hypothetical protein [Planktothrix sp. FACHB-1365]MBD2482282.1 hypothetical protein [Planktothrix sp. FACHB-1365]